MRPTMVKTCDVCGEEFVSDLEWDFASYAKTCPDCVANEVNDARFVDGSGRLR